MTIGKRHALLLGPFFMFLVAFILHINQMYVMFAALGFLAPVSYALARRKLTEIHVSRHGKSVMTAGEMGTVTLTVRNAGRLRQFFLKVRDTLPDGLDSPEGGQVLVADLPAGVQERLQYSLLARRRGVYRVGPPVLESSDFLGLYKFLRRTGDTEELLVYPRALPIPNLWPRSVRGRMPHKARRRVVGPSTEFYGIRDYYPGDDLRRVDWKTSARRGKLSVVETEQSDSTEAVIIVDLLAAGHAGRGDESTVEYAATLAASLAAEALGRGCTVGLIAHGAEDQSVPASPSPRQQVLLLEALARMRADGSQHLGFVIAAHERELPPGCAVTVISPGADAALVGVATRLRALEHPVTWLALAPHTFDEGRAKHAPEFEGLVARLAAHGARVLRIRGDLPLETNLWRGTRRAHST